MSISQVHTALERLSNLLRVEARMQGSVEGLLPVQLEVLHYLYQCNRYSDTVQGVSEYLGQTKGTVSQTLKVLDSRGLLRKQPDTKDRRLVHLRITAKGEKLLVNVVPARFLVEALDSKPARETERLAEDLKDLLRAAQAARRMKTFGACKTCRFNESSQSGFRCGLTGESLTIPDIERICREHQYPLASEG
ncbi:MAG: MarR family winged helix-turn-helix transcriptional regulator [Candidatus Thiodiazotropha sp. (ex Monitilora ramsayi)]|nr:MarR family winged helix-turn-helix transcriptional regulator [Candidatus Thiodiazotropha sp. (ex Monitilora ramsayi)]